MSDVGRGQTGTGSVSIGGSTSESGGVGGAGSVTQGPGQERNRPATEGTGEYSKVGGHHVHAKSAFKEM